MKTKNLLLLIAALSGFFYAQNLGATCSNPASYSDGQTLTAASLNNNFGSLATCANNILDGDTFTGTINLHSGADFKVYSDAGSTLKFDLDGATGDFTTEGVFNLGTGGVVLSDDGDGALTITGAGNGSDEALTVNLDDTSNAAVISTSTGVTSVDLHSIGMNVFSDAGTTLKGSINKTTGAATIGLTHEGEVSNCSMAVSGSTFTISGYDGTALSATNPCIVSVRTTSGKPALAYFTSNVTFTFGSSSDTDTNTFGITSSANWSNVMPFFLGVIYDGTTPYFTISRVPTTHTQGSGDPNGVCQKGDTACNDESAAMILATGLTLSAWTDKPITQIGWFFMTYATAGGAWTASLSATMSHSASGGTNNITYIAGLNDNYKKIVFTFPQAQNSAQAGSHITCSGCTVPQFSTESYLYKISDDGTCENYIFYTGDGGTDGSGPANFYFALPLSLSTVTSEFSSFYITNPTTSHISMCSQSDSACLKQNVSGSNLQNTVTAWDVGDFTNGSRIIKGTIRNKCYNL